MCVLSEKKKQAAGNGCHILSAPLSLSRSLSLGVPLSKRNVQPRNLVSLVPLSVGVGSHKRRGRLSCYHARCALAHAHRDAEEPHRTNKSAGRGCTGGKKHIPWGEKPRFRQRPPRQLSPSRPYAGTPRLTSSASTAKDRVVLPEPDRPNNHAAQLHAPESIARAAGQ